VPNIANSKEKDKSSGLVPMSVPVWSLLVKVGFTPREHIAWVKTHDTQLAEANLSFCGNATAWGSWQSPSNPFCRCFLEFVLVAHKVSPSLTWQGKSDITKEEFLRDTKNFWLLPAETNRDHPAPFALELPTRLMKLYTYVGDTVLDPFVGSGTTVRAATNIGRIGAGVDVSTKYLQRAALRCSQLAADGFF
jgi:site-specific DNA-methyltransferase (adenine-specific)